MCSRCRIPNGLQIRPTYELLHVLHFNLYAARAYFILWYSFAELVVQGVVISKGYIQVSIAE